MEKQNWDILGSLDKHGYILDDLSKLWTNAQVLVNVCYFLSEKYLYVQPIPAYEFGNSEFYEGLVFVHKFK